MIFISHRGNIGGINIAGENSEESILEAINQGYECEIDVWYKNGEYFLGHETPQFITSINFLKKDKLWIHCKNIEALYQIHNLSKCFFHNGDDVVLTSNNFLWTYVGKLLTPDSICVLPELSKYSLEHLKNCYAICSDNIQYYKNLIQKL